MDVFIDNITKFFTENIKQINIISGLAFLVVFTIFKTPIAKGILNLILRIIIRKDEKKREPFKSALLRPLSSFIMCLGIFIAVYLNFRFKGVVHCFKIVTILLICWAFFNYLQDNLFLILHFDGDSKHNKTAVKFISNILKILVAVFAIVMIISELGYNINGLITGLGVGGLAISLAAQDAVSNLISGFIIVTEKPFVEGDFIQTKSIQGTVVEVSMRSTRIRTLEDSLITLPNSSLTNEAIINLSKIEKRLIDIEFGLVYSTPSELMKKCQKDIKEYLINREDIINEPLRVEFEKLDDSSLNLNVFVYTTEADIHRFKAVLSEVNFAIKEIIENNGAEFAYPSTSVYIEKK